ncbi:MAG TPA: PLP-dependent aminotransferase family protein [Telluria sp.]|nr:PLP-dependent aminotransferase family protein [Telluria sp.]
MATVRFHEGPLRAFRVSMPGIDLFPFDTWSRLEARRWRRPDHHMGYSDPAGYAPLRELLCVYLRASRGVNCTPEQIVITSGSQQEDDYDSEYRYTGPPLASLQSLDRADCTIYVGTLSKVLFPGLRLGYVVAPPALVEPLVRAKAVMDRHNAIMPQMVLADFIAAGHFGRHIKRTREAYAERRAALLAGIDRHLADEFACGPSDAGLDLCLHFRRPHDEARIAAAAHDAGIELRPLSYYASRNAGPACAVAPGLVLGFAAIPPADIALGVKALARVMRAAR